MEKMDRFIISFCCLFILVSQNIYAQQKEGTTNKPSKVLIENADRSLNEIKDKQNIQYLKGNVRAIHDSIFMFCDSAILKQNLMTAIGEVVIIQDDTIRIFSDSLFYNGDTKQAELYFGVVLENKDKKIFTESLFYDLKEKQAYFRDTCLLVSGTTRLSSLRARYNVKSNMAYFYDEVTAIDGQTRFKSDSLLYDTDIDRAYFITETFIEQDNKRIYCTDGFYDLAGKRAFFSGNPIYYSEDKFARAEYMSYIGKDSITMLEGKAFVRDSISEARAKKIILDEKTGNIFLEGNASYKEKDKLIEGERIVYNQETEDVNIDGSCLINMENGTLKGDSLEYLKSIDKGIVSGNAVWLDTVDNREIRSDIFYYREKDEYFKAVVKNKRPLVKQLVDNDTLYFSADSLTSARNPEDSMKYLEAVRHVKIFKSNLQAVCDSMYFSEKDSIIHLLGSPIVWSDTTQFTADTILLILKNDEIREIIAKNKAFIASSELGDYFNQIKGKIIHAYLDSNALQKMIVNGNAESLYFIKDEEDAFVGPTKTLCRDMAFYFDDNELLTIRYYTEPDSDLIPLKKAGPDELKLKGFSWHIRKKPKKWQDVLLVESSTRIPARPQIQDSFGKDVEEVMKNISNKKKGK